MLKTYKKLWYNHDVCCQPYAFIRLIDKSTISLSCCAFCCSFVVQQHCHPQKRPGFHCAKRCTNREQKKVASIHKYFSSNCLVKCHPPYTAICWAIHLASPQSARQHDHQLCNAQEHALLKRVFSQLISCKHCSQPTLCGSRLSSFLYMIFFIQFCELKLILCCSSNFKCSTEQTLQVVSLFPATKNWLTNSYYLVPLRRGGSLTCWKRWAVWCLTVPTPGLPTCLFCSSQSCYSFSYPKFPLGGLFFLIIYLSSLFFFPSFSWTRRV